MNTNGYRVLLVEDDDDFTFVTTERLTSHGHRVVAVPSVHDALAHLDSDHAIDVVLLDLGLPDISGLDGVRATTDAGGPPVVVYTSDSRPATQRAARELGAAAVLVKTDVDAVELDRAVRDAALHRHRLPSTEQHDAFGAHHGLDAAIQETCSLLGAMTGLPCWAFVRPLARAHVVLVRSGPGSELPSGSAVWWRVPAMDAADVAAGRTYGAGVIATAEDVDVVVAHAVVAPVELDAAGHGTLVGWSLDADPGPAPHLGDIVAHGARTIATLHELARQRDGAQRRADIAGSAASVDVLTQLGNRRAFDIHLRAEDDRCARHGHGGVVFVVDLDLLKSINDAEGHVAGDRHLRTAAAALTEAMRPSDVVFRTGGDEFAMVAVRCDEADAPGIEARMREHLDEAGVDASIGWAARPPESTLLQAFAAADEAMYRQKLARRAGRASGKPTDDR